ncbi:hypothetical protein BJ878DRAFT_526406 [Calycina marina]|uniref:Ysc84 actin-binding domain-containing protein n=1 Tax=Calycina marina TaxID=1763456 RepID=A0A9P8CBA7_9HELO|nr:hypothetical protein BJ878DRAFT_526406 [Calycina marina]
MSNLQPTAPTGAPTPVTSKPTTPTKASFFDKTKYGGKAAFDKGWAMFEKLGVPVNKLTNKIGSEAFWPSTLDNESDKSARILKSFCKDGFYTEQATRPGASAGPKGKPKVLVKIPQKVIQNCVGLAIFSVMRTGLWVSGAGGSGVLIAKKPDGSWSPPTGILIHTLGVGFMAGIDIYDCVLVINSREALTAFSKLRVSLGGEISVVAGPLGIGGNLESELLKDRKPVFSYMKSRGLYGGIQLDGTIIVERNDENARFYKERLGINDILAGKVKHIPAETRLLMEVVKEAEGRRDVDSSVLETVHAQPAPGDVMIESVNKPSAEQQATYAPPEGYYAPNHGYPADLKVDHSEQSHPYHPGPPEEQRFAPSPGYAGQGSSSEAHSHGQPAPSPMAYLQNQNASVQHGTQSTTSGQQGDFYETSTSQQPGAVPYFPPPPPGPPPSHTAQAVTHDVQTHGDAQNYHHGALTQDDKSSKPEEQYYPPPPPGPPPHQ